MIALTKDEIFGAANKVARSGKIPTILAVRKELGDRGSETTLNKYLKEWKQNLLVKQEAGCVFCNDIDLYKTTINYVREQIRVLLQDVKNYRVENLLPIS